MTDQLFVVDVDKCTGCGLCIVACKDEHVDSEYMPWTKPQPEAGHFWMNVKPLERGSAPRLKMSFLPVMCQHCEEAPCIPACSDGAIKTREDGLVWIDAGLCTGCGDCQEACPYEVIYKNEDLNIAQKCTGCAHRVDEDLQPRCSEMCPHDAITFTGNGETTDSNADADVLEVFHPEFEAVPRVLWKGLPKPWIAGTVTTVSGDEVIPDADIVVTPPDSGSINIRSDAFGDFWVYGLGDGDTYQVNVTKEGYEGYNESVTTDGDQDLGTIRLSKL